MPITVYRAEQSDQKRWDEYVLSHPMGGPYHLFAWKRAVENAYYHECPYLMAEDGQRVIRGVFPLVLMKPPLLRPVLVSLPFCDYGGVLSDGPEAARELVSSALELAKSHRAEPDIRCRLEEPVLGESPQFAVSNFKVRMVLDLPDSAEELWNGFKSKLRSQIRKPGKEGLEFRIGSLELLDDFYNVFRHTMKDLGSPVHAKRWFECVLEAFADRARVGVVHLRGRAVAAGIALECGRTLTIPWASTLREYNHLSSNMLLYWGFLEHACTGGFKLFDFGRSTPDEGTYRFKQQWGARPEPLFWYSPSGRREEPAPASKNGARKLAEKAWSRLPQTVADTLGPKVRKFISL
ncbi:MAG: FemAB family XrtA/PEP-CTERM system-associated protein [Desulfomonilia bacterium]